MHELCIGTGDLGKNTKLVLVVASKFHREWKIGRIPIPIQACGPSLYRARDSQYSSGERWVRRSVGIGDQGLFCGKSAVGLHRQTHAVHLDRFEAVFRSHSNNLEGVGEGNQALWDADMSPMVRAGLRIPCLIVDSPSVCFLRRRLATLVEWLEFCWSQGRAQRPWISAE